MQGYDLAGNVAWRAPGVNLGSDTCESEGSIPPVKKIWYTYDFVIQLATVSYGDGSPDIVRTYWNDGLLKTIDSNGAAWSYGYNSLRKPTTEQLVYSGKTYSFGWDYDADGNLTALTYPPGGPNATYLPNALGEPSQVGSYVTNVAFHPNGAISGFTFGNSIVHSLTQTVEGTPKLNTDGTVLQDLYTYDANGNVATIADQRGNPSDGWFNRSMAYDDLDRLSGVTALGVWGNAAYVYDPVDNLRTANVGTRSSTLTYGAAKRLDSVVTSGVSTAYAYDGNGNISQKGGQTYTFDLGNRMASASLGGVYSYDGHGRRSKVVNGDGTSQIQVYSQGGQLLWSEKNAAGTFPATASCSTGTLLNGQCVTTSTYPATEALSCTPGDTLSGSICTHTTTYTATASYSCPSGGGLSGTSCSRDDSYAASFTLTCNAGDTRSGSTCTHASTYTATTSYSCNAGDSLSGSTCSHTNYVAASVSYSCPSGYTVSGSICSQSTTVTATSTYNCNGSGTLNASGLCTGGGTLAYSYYEAWDTCMAQADSYGVSLDSVTLVSGRRYNCTFQANVDYSCPAGATLSGDQCTSTIRQSATVNYSCSNGVLSGSQCAVAQTYTATSSYSCPSGGSRSGTTCTLTNTYTATANYSCPSGGTLSGSTCKKTTVYAATAAYSCPNGSSLSGSTCSQTNTYAATSGYSCTAGDSLSGSTCTRSTAVAATPSYSCPNGATLSGNQCTGTNTTKTAYIYLGGKQIAETVVGGLTQYVHTDALGSPVAHTNQARAELNRTKFEPYGYTAAGTKPGPKVAGQTTTESLIGFTGHVNDPQTDLVYMQQRYYDPIAGRFLSIDPAITDANSGSSFNRYAYASNSPYKYIDPDGRNSYLVSRPLGDNSDSKLLVHNFIVTHANSIGDQKATVTSYGRQTNGKTGVVDESTQGMSKGTAARDAKYWKSLATDKKLGQEMTSQIKADDSKAQQIANSVAPTSSYTITPATSAYGTNSNSAASAVADRAQGSEVQLPNAEGRVSIGEGQKTRIEFVKPQ